MSSRGWSYMNAIGDCDVATGSSARAAPSVPPLMPSVGGRGHTVEVRQKETVRIVDVRPARDEDLASILAIYNHAIATTTAVFDDRPHTLEMRHEWFRAKQAASLPVLVGVNSEDVLGFGTYGPFRAWPGYKYTIEHSVYVAESARRRGVGRALVEALLAGARDGECHTVIAGIVSDNVASLRLHESLGFVEVAHLHEVGYKFGRWLDLKLLQLLLATPRQPVEP